VLRVIEDVLGSGLGGFAVRVSHGGERMAGAPRRDASKRRRAARAFAWRGFWLM